MSNLFYILSRKKNINYDSEYDDFIDKIVRGLKDFNEDTDVPGFKEFYTLSKEIREKGIIKKITEKKGNNDMKKLQLALMESIAKGFTATYKRLYKKRSKRSLARKTKKVKDIYEIFTAIEESNKLSTSTEKALRAVLGDEQAFIFWKTNVATSVNSLIRANDFWKKLCAVYPDKDFKSPVNWVLEITPYALRTVVDLCDGWNNFVEACKESNPFDSVICTKSRASSSKSTVRDMAPKEGGKFYKDRATVGQAPFGSFFLLVKTHPDAEEEADKWSVLSTKDRNPVLVHAPKSLPDSWKMESNGRILSVNSRKYLAWSEESTSISLQSEYGEGLDSWSIKNGIIYCLNVNSEVVREYPCCICSDGKSLIKGDGSMGNSVVFTFVNYLPWIEGDDDEDDEDDDDDEEEYDDEDDDDDEEEYEDEDDDE